MNGCMHRDLQSNMPLRIYEFARHLEITNAGGLYGNARPENFPTINDYRNPLIASAMKTMGYVNMFNRGVGQVQTDLKENGNPPAEFVVNLVTAFRVNVKDVVDHVKNGAEKTELSQVVPSSVPGLSRSVTSLSQDSENNASSSQKVATSDKKVTSSSQKVATSDKKVASSTQKRLQPQTKRLQPTKRTSLQRKWQSIFWNIVRHGVL